MNEYEWIGLLKPGDKVVIDLSRYGMKNEKVSFVEKVTPTGRVLVGRTYYDKNGREICNRSAWSQPEYLTQWTQEKEQAIKDRAEISELSTYLENFALYSKLPLLVLRDIVKIVKDNSPKAKASQ